MKHSPTLMVAAVVVMAAGCSTNHESNPSSASTHVAAPTVGPADVAAPYVPPARPPQSPGPLQIRPSKDAVDRLSRVLAGKLVDSGNFHGSGFNPGDPLTSDPYDITFTTPSRHISCTGNSSSLVCISDSATLPRPPQPVDKPSGNWEPYIELGAELTYGVAAGNPMVPAEANVLPYGSTIRFGDIECLSARDGITCVDFPASVGFHLSRDDLTPMRTVNSLAPDDRVEPRTPGNQYCGAVVTDTAIRAAIPVLPNSAGLHWTPMGAGEFYSCRDVQVFEVGTNDVAPHHELPYMPSYVLVFDRGRFVAAATDHPYPGLRGEVDASDPTLIRLVFNTLNSGKESRATVRARYERGAVVLLDPIPEGAIAAT